MTDYLPGTAGLIEEIDKKHLVVLRDGRTLIGFLSGFDKNFLRLLLFQCGLNMSFHIRPQFLDHSSATTRVITPKIQN